METTNKKKLVWDAIGDRTYEAGVEQCVFYEQASDGSYPNGEAWNGMVGITDKPSGAEATPLYANNQVYLNMTAAEKFDVGLECYTYPDGFGPCCGVIEVTPGAFVTAQTRKPFGLSYVSGIGNDTDGIDHGHKLHLVYGCLAATSETAHSTINESAEAATMSFDASTTPVAVTTKVNDKKLKNTSHLIIDSTKTDSSKMDKLIEILQGKNPTTDGGDDGVAARLPLPDEIFTILNATADET